MTNRQIQAPERYRAVHMEEVGGQHGRGLYVQELPPGRIGAPLGSQRDPQRLEDPADRGRTGPVTEFQQFALDPLVPPRGVLGGERSISAAISTLTSSRPVRFG